MKQSVWQPPLHSSRKSRFARCFGERNCKKDVVAEHPSVFGFTGDEAAFDGPQGYAAIFLPEHVEREAIHVA